MSQTKPIGAAEWLCPKLLEHHEVSGAKVANEHLIEVNRKKYPSVRVCAINMKSVCEDHILYLIESAKSIDIVTNIPREHQISRGLYGACEIHEVGYGGMAELFRGLSRNPIPIPIDSEGHFILRSLRQHSAVSFARRIDHRRYEIERICNPKVEIVATNAYDVTVDDIRSVVERYGVADAIICSNPNHRISSKAHDAAIASGWKLMGWSAFYGSLNRTIL